MRVFQNANRFAIGFVVVAGLFLWGGCDSTGDLSTAEGQFTLRLTDAPAALDSAVVTVDRVNLVSEEAEEEEDEDEEAEGVITLTDSARTIDLLQLQNGVTETLATTTVPEGEYTQLRFVLGSENYVVVDGTQQSLQVPSGQQSGIKIVLPEVEVENDGDQLEVTLDFDVEESFVQQGNGQYLFKPTIQVKSVSVNGESVETVEVDGAVSSASSSSVEVDSIPFSITDHTEFDGDGGASAPADLEVGQVVEVEGTFLEDGTLEARELDAEDDDEVERSITAPIQAVGDSSFTVVGVSMTVDEDTEFDDDTGLSALEAGHRVEVDYEFRDGARVALEVEHEGD